MCVCGGGGGGGGGKEGEEEGEVVSHRKVPSVVSNLRGLSSFDGH